MENVLILNGLDCNEKFFNCIKMNEKTLYNQLREEIITSNEIKGIWIKRSHWWFFNYPNFKNSGGFEDLNFDLN